MKILISDFDKTFYTENYDNNIKLINEFVNAGNKFVIATGRPLYFLEPSIEGKNINYYNLICSDGTVIFDKNNKKFFWKIFEVLIDNLPNPIEGLKNKFELLFPHQKYIHNEFVTELKRKITEKSLTKQSDNTKQKIKQ